MPKVKIKVTNQDHVIKAFVSAAQAMQDNHTVLKEIAQLVEQKAVERVPVLTGRLRSSIDFYTGKHKAVISAGPTDVPYPYGPIVHYGDPVRGHAAQPFLTDALAASESEAGRMFTAYVKHSLKKTGL